MKPKDEALKMAIEALEMHVPYYIKDKGCDALIACKEALEQPSQEPVALKFPTMLRKMWTGGEVQEWLNKQPPLYTHPAPSWQGLSDDEINDIKTKTIMGANGMSVEQLLGLIVSLTEQALRNKNGY